MGRWPIAGVALTAACSAAEAPSFLDLAALNRDLVVVAILSEDDAILETQFVDLGAASAPRSLISVPQGGRLVGAAFDRSALEAQTPRLDPERLSELGLAGVSPEAASCVEGVLRLEESRAQVRWPEDTRAFEWDFELERRVDRDLAVDWFGRVSPLVPIRIDHCAGHPNPSLRLFATEAPILDAGSLIEGQPFDPSLEGMTEFIRIDERFVLATIGRYVVLSERGLGFIDQPGRAITFAAAWRARSISIGAPDPNTGVRRIAILVASGSADMPDTITRLFEGTLEGDTLRLGSMLLETTNFLDAVYVNPVDDRIIVFERPSQIYLERADRSLEPAATLPGAQTEGEKRGRFLPSGVPETPIALVGTRANTLYLGTSDARTWTNVQEGLSLGLTIRAFAASRPQGDQRSLYVGNTAGHLFQRGHREGRWSPILPRINPELIELGCATADDNATCGFGRPQHSWQHLTAFEDSLGQRALLGLTDFCSMAFIIRPDGCTSNLKMDVLGALIRSADNEIFTARSEAGYVTVATELGELFEISWGALGLEP